MARRARRPALRVVAAAAVGLVLVVAAVVVGVNARVDAYEARAIDDLREAAVSAGFDRAEDVGISYPFWVEGLELVSKGSPFPWSNYASLVLVLGECRIEGVLADPRPDTDTWLPRRIEVRDVLFYRAYDDGSAGRDPRPISDPIADDRGSVSFRSAAELRAALERKHGIAAPDDAQVCAILGAPEGP